jgi:hypothetical protein
VKNFYFFSVFLFFAILSCKSKPANPRTTFFNFLNGRTISGPAEFWHMNIKGKNFYFFSDVHESEEGGCSNCSKPNCARIEETFAEYFKKSNSHFFIESEFQNKDSEEYGRDALRPAFLSKTIQFFTECLHNSQNKELDSLCKQKYPNTFFHYADIRDALIVLHEISSLRDLRSKIKKNEEKGTIDNKAKKDAFSISKKAIKNAKNYFQKKEQLKKFVDLFVYEKEFTKRFEKEYQLFEFPIYTKEDDKSRSFSHSKKNLDIYKEGPHKISKQINKKIPDTMKEILKKYYEEEMEKTFNIYYPNYDENIKKVIALETSTDERLIFNKDLKKFNMLVFHINYVLSNIYALGRMIRILEDPSDTKDFVLYWGGSHIQHFLQFFSKHYETPVKPAAIEIKNFRCIKVL